MESEAAPEKSGGKTPRLDKAEGQDFGESIFPTSPQSPRSPLEPLSLNVDPDEFDPLSNTPGFTQFGETAESLSPKFKAYTKLEVLNAKGINRIALIFNICVVLSIVFSIISIILSRTVFSRVFNIPGLPSNLRVYQPERWFVRLESALSFLLSGYSIILFFSFLGFLLKHILVSKQTVSNEQIWVVFLLFFLMLYENPYDAIIRISDTLGSAQNSRFRQGMSVVFECVRMTSFSFVSLLYVWFCSHSYRRLANPVTARDFLFYMPKLAVVLFYVTYKLVFLFVFGIAFSELPFASLLGCIQLYGTLNKWPVHGVVSVSLLTVIEVGLCAAILYDIYLTIQVHATADYLAHRTKQVGFRFFIHQHLIFYTAYAIIYAVVLFGFPVSIQVLLFYAGSGAALVKTRSEASYFDTQYAPFGLHLAVLAYATIEAFTGLPATVILSPWRHRYRRIGAFAEPGRPGPPSQHTSATGSTLRSSGEPEPVSYRRNEPGGQSVVSKPNCFTMATHIKLFNLSWYIYYYGTPKEQKLSTDLSQHNMQVVKCISCAQTDTRVLVLEAGDRICVSFKGTSSPTNISTDVKMVQMALRHALPTELPLDNTPNAADFARSITPPVPGSPAAESAALQRSPRFRRARVHVGFAKAYASVAHELLRTVRDLLAAHARPVLLCGHSLGGALATLASADVVLQPWWARLRGGETVLVSTFGSPRVGNGAFRAVYEELGITHWRVVAGGDVIARLPAVGYQHVGKRVAISARGDLFVDPDALEARLWHRPAASIVHHRKATYLLALRGWCQKHHGAAQGFWDFPISKADSKRFHEAFSKRGVGAAAAAVPVDAEVRAKIRLARLKVWADAVDLLEPRSVHEVKQMTALERWTRLTKAVVADLRKHAGSPENDDGPLSVALLQLAE